MNANDKGSEVQMIGALLPYCDAMYLDRQCHGLVIESPVADRISAYRTKIFSGRNKDDFIDYLREIEAGAPDEHLALVREVIRENLE